MTEQDKVFKHRIECLLKTISYSSFSWELDKEELKQAIQTHIDKELTSDLLDAGECFVAASEIEEKFPGPAILLYVSSVNVFADGPDIELQRHIDSAKNLLNENKLLENKSVEITVDIAYQKAEIMRVIQFLKMEFEDGLRKANYPETNETIPDIAKKIVEASHKVRHRAQIGGAYNSLFAITDAGDVYCLERQEMKDLERKGRVKVTNAPIKEIFPIVARDFSRLIKPSRLGSANAITKRAKNLRSE